MVAVSACSLSVLFKQTKGLLDIILLYGWWLISTRILSSLSNALIDPSHLIILGLGPGVGLSISLAVGVLMAIVPGEVGHHCFHFML